MPTCHSIVLELKVSEGQRANARSRARSWLRRYPALHRRTTPLRHPGTAVRSRLRHPGMAVRSHILLLRHVFHLYRTLAGQLELEESDFFLHELADRKEFFRRAFHYLTFNGIDGDYAEFGCHGGMTFRIAWSACQNARYEAHLWGFDSFEGLPQGDDPRDGHLRRTPGWLATSLDDFHEICALAAIPPDRYTAIPGYYKSSLRPGADGSRPEKISLAYIDCDLYSSTVEVLQFLEPRLRPGSVVGFDDWFCYSSAGPSGERLAALEHFAESAWRLVPFVQYGWFGMSFLVEDREAVPAPVGAW
jgi:O-methyltransferase